jgi:hypothetical protein
LSWWLVVRFEVEGKEVDPARLTAGNDPVITGEAATVRCRIAAKSRHERGRFQVLHLQRLVL